MVQLFIIKSWMRIPSNNTFHYFLSIKPNDDKLLKVCKIHQIPNRRTIDRRFQNLPISTIINTMGNLFVSEKLVDVTSASIDSSLLKASGPVWHKSDMKNNHLPIVGIDMDAKWDYSKSKGWIFGYKLHIAKRRCFQTKYRPRITKYFEHDNKIQNKLEYFWINTQKMTPYCKNETRPQFILKKVNILYQQQ